MGKGKKPSAEDKKPYVLSFDKECEKRAVIYFDLFLLPLRARYADEANRYTENRTRLLPGSLSCSIFDFCNIG